MPDHVQDQVEPFPTSIDQLLVESGLKQMRYPYTGVMDFLTIMQAHNLDPHLHDARNLRGGPRPMFRDTNFHLLMYAVLDTYCHRNEADKIHSFAHLAPSPEVVKQVTVLWTLDKQLEQFDEFGNKNASVSHGIDDFYNIQASEALGPGSTAAPAMLLAHFLMDQDQEALALLQSPALRPDDSAQCLSLMTLVYLRNDKPANAFMMLQQVEASQDDSTVQEDKHMYEVAFRTFCDLMIR